MAKIIAISQQKGGAGKSTIAVNLSVALNKRGNRVALIDIDPQGSTSTWYQVREELFGKSYTGINFSSCSGMRVNSEITTLKNSNDYIIIDCPPHTDTESKTAIRAADIVLIPMQPSPTDLWATGKTLEFAEIEKKLVKIILNRFTPNMKISKNLNFPEKYLLKSYIGNRVGFASSMAVGKTILETEPSSVGSNEIKNLTNEILDIFN
jgi:chromosome partitioning protein